MFIFCVSRCGYFEITQRRNRNTNVIFRHHCSNINSYSISAVRKQFFISTPVQFKQIYMRDTFLLSEIWGVNQIINRTKFLKNSVRSTIFSLQRITRLRQQSKNFLTRFERSTTSFFVISNFALIFLFFSM